MTTPRKLPKATRPVKIYLVQWRDDGESIHRMFTTRPAADTHLRWARDAYDPGAVLTAYAIACGRRS